MDNKVTLTPFRLLCALCIVLISLLDGRLSSAAQGTTSGGDIRTIYYGEVTTFSKLGQELDTKGIRNIYCANQVTPKMQNRGYADAKLDSIICFNTAAEMKAQGVLNQKVASAVPLGARPQITPTQSSGAGVRPLYGSGFLCGSNYTRFALYQYSFNTSFISDVCDLHKHETNLNGVGAIGAYGLACMAASGYQGFHYFYWQNGSNWLATPDPVYFNTSTVDFLGNYSC